MAKLKNVRTGELRDAVSLDYDLGGLVTGLAFSPENGRWKAFVVQRWNAVTASAETFWVPAEPGVDY